MAFFVYVPETDRTRFVLQVVARVADETEDDCVDRAILVFHPDFSDEFAVGVAQELHDLVDDIDARPTLGEPHIRVHLKASMKLMNKLKDRIIY